MKKKIILGVILAGGTLLLSGCGAKEVEKVEDFSKGDKVLKCTLSSKDAVNNYEVESTYNAYYKEDGDEKIVTGVVTKESVTSTNSSLLDQFEETLNTTYSTLSDTYGGYTFEVKKTDDKVTSVVKIDYGKMDRDQLVKDNSAMKQYMNDDNNLTYEGIKAMYEAQGAVCE